MPTWEDVLKPIKNSEKFQTLLAKVNDAYNTTTVYPHKDDLFRAFALTPFDHVKCVIIGQDPYHGETQANGLAFSVNPGVSVPPSLRNIFKELHNDLGLNVPSHGDLTPWAKQGVLLLNTTLSVEANQPASHKHLGWDWFTDRVIETINNHPKPIVFMLWGKHAQRKKALIDESRHLVVESSHPSPFSAHQTFFGSKPFSRCNDFLVSRGRTPVDFTLV